MRAGLPIIQDESGRPTFNFTAKGTVANPSVRPDVREAGKRAIQQVGQELFKGNPVDDLQKTLKNIFH